MKQSKSVKVTFLGIVVGILISLGAAQGAQAQNTVAPHAVIKLDPDVRHFVHPVFDSVKQVFIHVHSSGADSIEYQSELPAPMRTEKLEALLVQIYRHRFSSKDCTQVLEPGPQLMDHKYGCEDQPVVLIRDSEAGAYRATLKNQPPGTLNVELQVFIDRSLIPPVAAVNLIQDRSDPEIPTGAEVTFPWIIPLNLDDNEVHKRLFTYISNKIR